MRNPGLVRGALVIPFVLGVCRLGLLESEWLATAQSAQQWEREARGAIELYFRGANMRDPDAYYGGWNFPHYGVGGNGRITTSVASREDAQELIRKGEPRPAWKAMEREGWVRTSLDLAEAVLVGPDKVHFKIVWSRHNASGAAYRSEAGLWIVTRQDGHWGLQLRSGVPAAPAPSAQDAQEWEREARAAVELNFRGANTRDPGAYWRAFNFPLYSIGNSGRITVRAESRESAQELIRKGEPWPVWKGMEKEGWTRTSLDLAEPVHVASDRVHFKIVWTRYNTKGEAYQSGAGVWIVTRQDGRWGVQVQS